MIVEREERDLKVRSIVTDTVDLIRTPLPMAISADFVDSELEMLHKYL